MFEGGIALTGPTAAAAAGASASLLGAVLYLRGIGRGGTRPHRATWLVWTVIAVVAATSHGADGGGQWSLVVLWGQALTSLAVLVVALPRGVGGLTAGNGASMGVATVGVIGWISLEDPVSATVCAAVADASGLSLGTAPADLPAVFLPGKRPDGSVDRAPATDGRSADVEAAVGSVQVSTSTGVSTRPRRVR